MWYLWLKALHVVAVIAWMAGMLYLPRLYVYHAAAARGGELSETFKVMERRLLRGIINPAMIVTWITGLALAFGPALNLWNGPDWSADGWLHAKLALVLAMQLVHAAYARWRRQFAQDDNRHGATYYRFANEVPTVLLIAIVILVIVKPF